MKQKLFRFSWRTLILASLIILLNNTSFSQTWPSPGAKWTYCLTGWNGMPAGEETFEVTGDTLISGKLYNIIQPINPTKKNLVVNNNSIRTLYTRYVNDTVYRYVNNQEYLFFTYNLSVGDVFSTFRTAGWNYNWEDSACSSILPLRVIEESEVELNGQVLKKFVLEDTLFRHLYVPNYHYPVTYTLIERIGVINTYHFINTIEPPEDCSLPTDWGLANLGKYSDDSFEHLFEECEGVGINDILKPKYDIEIFPNPFKKNTSIEFYLENKSYVELSVFNFQGKKIRDLINQNLNSGNHIIKWNGLDQAGKPCKPAPYFVYLNVNGTSIQSIKLIKY